MERPRGWHSRGFLPHYDPGCEPQFLTWRLDDSIPVDLYLAWKRELGTKEPSKKQELYRRIEKYLDACHGSCLLREPTRALITLNALRFYDGTKYTLGAHVIMPNHVHAIITPLEGHQISDIVRGIKGFSGKEIRRVFGGHGRIWQPDYFDRMIRDVEHMSRVAKYIEWNPVKANLCFDPRVWPYSSAFSK